jgi:hypothetical protein
LHLLNYHMKKSFCTTFLCFLFFPLPSTAQDYNEIGTWNILNVRDKIGKKFTIMAEGQIRSLSFYNQFHYYEIKTGIGYAINKSFTVLGGIGRFNTYQVGGNFLEPAQQKEIRTWLELVMKQPLDRLQFEHRYRAEQRFTTNGYRNRFRYRLALLIPLNAPEIKEGSIYTIAWNELFLGDMEPFFQRNRSFIGLGRKMEVLTLQSGIVYQYDYRLTDEVGRFFFQISLGIEFGKKQTNRPLPLQED